jgi:hypothetical protein
VLEGRGGRAPEDAEVMESASASLAEDPGAEDGLHADDFAEEWRS